MPSQTETSAPDTAFETKGDAAATGELNGNEPVNKKAPEAVDEIPDIKKNGAEKHADESKGEEEHSGDEEHSGEEDDEDDGEEVVAAEKHINGNARKRTSDVHAEDHDEDDEEEDQAEPTVKKVRTDDPTEEAAEPEAAAAE